jgi:hypothetical protein
MKKFILLGLIVLFVSSCSKYITQYDVVEGLGHIYQCSTFYYDLPQVKKQFPNYILIERSRNYWFIYIKE